MIEPTALKNSLKASVSFLREARTITLTSRSIDELLCRLGDKCLFKLFYCFALESLDLDSFEQISIWCP